MRQQIGKAESRLLLLWRQQLHGGLVFFFHQQTHYASQDAGGENAPDNKFLAGVESCQQVEDVLPG